MIWNQTLESSNSKVRGGRYLLRSILVCVILIMTNTNQTAATKDSDTLLKVSANHRFLIHADGSPFFYLGDTAWELFHRLTIDESRLYLENRRSKGFNVIQAVVLSELDGLNMPNADGERPLVDNDPTKPNEAYFRHVDAVVDMAREKGCSLACYPLGETRLARLGGLGR